MNQMTFLKKTTVALNVSTYLNLHRRGIVQKMLHSSIYQTLQNSPKDLFCKFFITNTITTGFLLIDNEMLPVLTNKVTEMLLSKLKEKELRLLQSKP